MQKYSLTNNRQFLQFLDSFTVKQGFLPTQLTTKQLVNPLLFYISTSCQPLLPGKAEAEFHRNFLFTWFHTSSISPSSTVIFSGAGFCPNSGSHAFGCHDPSTSNRLSQKTKYLLLPCMTLCWQPANVCTSMPQIQFGRGVHPP